MIAYILFNTMIIVIAFIGNFLVMVVVALNEIFHNMKSFLLASLALSDFLYATLVTSSLIVSAALKEWIFGETWCHGSAFLTRILYTNTILHLCAVSYDRYRAIVKDHLSYDGRITPKRIIVSILVHWILPTVLCLGPFLGWGSYEFIPESYMCVQRWDSQSTFPFLIATFVAPFLFVFVLNYKVVKVARRLKRQVNVQIGSKNREVNVQMLQVVQFWPENEEANAKIRSPIEEYSKTGQASTQEFVGQNPSTLWKTMLRKTGQVNPGVVKHSEPGAESSRDRTSYLGKTMPVPNSPAGSSIKDESERVKKPGETKEVWSRFQFQRNKNTLTSTTLHTKNTARGGLVNVLKECKAARDTLVILCAFLVCYLPLWIHGIYHAVDGDDQAEHDHSSVVLLWISAYSATTICNPIIYSVRKKEFRKAVRKLFKI